MKTSKKTVRLQFTVFPEYAEKIKLVNTDPFDTESVYLMKLIDRELASLGVSIPAVKSAKPVASVEHHPKKNLGPFVKDSVEPEEHDSSINKTEIEHQPLRYSVGMTNQEIIERVISDIEDED